MDISILDPVEGLTTVDHTMNKMIHAGGTVPFQSGTIRGLPFPVFVRQHPISPKQIADDS